MEYKFSKEKQEVIDYLNTKPKSFIKFELLNLSIVILISIGMVCTLSKLDNKSIEMTSIEKQIIQLSKFTQKDNDILKRVALINALNDHYKELCFYNLVLTKANQAIVILVAFLLIRIFLNFQIYNTRRANHTQALVNALKLYESGDFEKLVSIISQEKYQNIKNLPDSILKKVAPLFLKE